MNPPFDMEDSVARSFAAPPAKQLIRITAEDAHLTVTAAEAAIMTLPVYQRDSHLVHPVVREVKASHGRMTLAAGLARLEVHRLCDLLSMVARFERYDARGKKWIATAPPMWVAHMLLARQGAWNLPHISGVITCPTLRPDGSLLLDPGYDASTRLHHIADTSLVLHPEVNRATRQLAEESLGHLDGLLAEFRFVNGVSRSVSLSAMVTAVVRGALEVAPMHAFRAPTAGSGKSYLVDLVSAICTGRLCPVTSAGRDETEMEKRLTGLLLAGYPMFSVDNVNGELAGDLLCQAIERPLLRVRGLGKSDIIEIENRACVFATGNNLRTRGDAVRRTLICDLDPQEERPETRQFTSDPVATVLENRGRYVSACLMIPLAYVAAGKPDRLPRLASFSDWSDLVRSALVWLECADPADSIEAARADDTELTDLREMLAVWAEAIGFNEITAAEVVKLAGETTLDAHGTERAAYPELRETMNRLFVDRRGTISGQRLGTWLNASKGRIVGGHRFVQGGIAHGNRRFWAVEAVNRG